MKKLVLLLFIFCLGCSDPTKPVPYERYGYKELGRVLAVEEFKDSIVKEPCMSVIIDANPDTSPNVKYKVYLIPIRNFHYSYETRARTYLYSRMKKDGTCEMEYALMNKR